MNKLIPVIMALLVVPLAIHAGQPMLPAKNLIFLLIHGESGKGDNETYKIFDNLKKNLEHNYDIEGRVYAFQVPNPSGALDEWVDAISDKRNSESLMNMARKACRERISWETGITDTFVLDELTPKEFVIMAHSFAGLAVRSYICSENYRGDIRMLVTLNTPNEGTEYPHILEVLETRTALKRLSSVGTKALKSVDAKGDLLKGLETIYELKQTYNSAMEVVDGAKKILKKFKETRTRLENARKSIEESASKLKPDEIIRMVKSSSDAIKNIINNPPKIDKSALKELKTAVLDNLMNQFNGPIKDFYLLMRDIDSCANGNIASVLQDVQNNREILQQAFSLETFMRSFEPQKIASYGVSADFSRYYASASCLIRQPEILFTHSTNLPALYSQVSTLLSYRDSFDFDPENLIAINFDPHPATYLERLKELETLDLIPVMRSLWDDINNLAELEPELQNLLVAFTTGKRVVKDVKSAIDKLQGISFQKDLDSIYAIARDIRKFRAKPDIAKLKEQIKMVECAFNAFKTITEFRPEFNFALNINTSNLGCTIDEAVRIIPEIELAIRNGYSPECGLAYIERIKSFLSLLKQPDIQLPALNFESLKNISISSPVAWQEVMKILGITEYITQILDAASCLVDAYHETMAMADEIESLVTQFTTTAKEESAESVVSLDNIISLGMMAFSVAKMLPKTIENNAAQSASLNTVGKKLAKALMKELWKEIENGGLLEVGFAETMRSKSAPSASDPVMASMAVGSDEISNLLSQLPAKFADSVLNQTKYRIVATRGVITPTKDGAKALDFLCGDGGTKGLLRAQIQAEIDKLVKKGVEEVRKRIMDEVTKQTDKFTKEMQDILKEELKPGGKFKEKLGKIKGGEEAYRQLVEYIQKTVGEVVEFLGGELATALASLGAEALLAVADKLAKLEPVQKAWQSLEVLDAINPAMIVSIYSTVKKIATDERGIPLLIAATYFSPLLKLGLYENGDFISTVKSQKGESVQLFKSARDVSRTIVDVDHPLSPFAGIAVLGLAMDAAALLSPDPASKETIRLSKIITVNLLSAGIAFARKDKLQDYFIKSHNKAIHYLESPENLDKTLFDIPSVTVTIK